MKKNLLIMILSIIIIILTSTTIIIYNKLQNSSNTNKTPQESLMAEKSNESIQLKKTKDEEVIEYVENINADIDEIILKEEIPQKDEKKLKELFVSLTDFIFYDGEINGVKFAELRNDIKESIIEIYEKIDNKIESKFPNYKEKIKVNGKKSYNNIKETLKELKEKIKEEYINEVGQENYNTLVGTYNDSIEDINNVYDEYKSYIDKTKEKSKDIYTKSKDKISKWYREYREG